MSFGKLDLTIELKMWTDMLPSAPHGRTRIPSPPLA